MSNLFEDSIEGEKLVASTIPVSLAKVRFGYGPGMQKDWVINSAKFLDYVSGWFRQSIETGHSTSMSTHQGNRCGCFRFDLQSSFFSNQPK